MDQIAETLKLNLLRFMRSKKIDQGELSKSSGVARPMVSRAMNGKMYNPTFKTLLAFASVFKCEPWELIKPEGAEPTPTVIHPDAEKQAEITAEKVLAKSNRPEIPPHLLPLMENFLKLPPESVNGINMILLGELKGKTWPERFKGSEKESS